MRVLITGGSGYIGSILGPFLSAHGHRVRVLDVERRPANFNYPKTAGARIQFMKGDMRNADIIDSALAGADAIVHLAAVVGYPACLRNPALTVDTNVNATKLLLESRRIDQKLIFASTGSVYGPVQDRVCTEVTATTPSTLYGQTKLEGETLTLAAGNCIIYRYATGFGLSPNMRYDLLPNNFLRQALTNGRIRLFEGSSRRSFIHVHDIARSILFGLDTWTNLADDVFNVGNEQMNCTKAELAQLVRELVSYELELDEFDTDPDQRNYNVSYEKIRRRGFATTQTLASGLTQVLSSLQPIGLARSSHPPNL